MSHSTESSTESLRCGKPARDAIQFTFNGQQVTAYKGDTIAAALLATGCRTLRRTARRNEPRGLFCGIGVCYECLMQVDGRPNVQACVTRVVEGMQVETQQGAGDWSVES